MNSFRRLSIGVRAKIDEVFTGMENHEALAQSSLKDLKGSVATAQVGLTRLKNDEARLRTRLVASEEQAQRWRERAQNEADDEQALECLRRSKQCQHSAGALTQRLAEHERATQLLKSQVHELETRYSELASRYQLMRAREARARAFETLHQDLAGLGGEVDQVFESWEGRVVRSEALGGLGLEAEELEQRYLQEEKRCALLVELKELRGAQ